MRFGLFGGPGGEAANAAARHPYLEFADYAGLAEELGFVSVFLTEHHFTGLGQASSPLTLLAHLAGVTSTLRLGTAVTVLPWQAPIIVAEQAATVDVLSAGRLDLGVGRGFRAAEFDGFGQSMAEAAERHEEALEVILRAWREPGRWSHRGRFYTYHDVVVEPAPVQSPAPADLGRRGKPVEPGRRRGAGLSPAARPGRELRADGSAHQRLSRAPCATGAPGGPGRDRGDPLAASRRRSARARRRDRGAGARRSRRCAR